jgi:peptidoglycan/xylan/chitin deacetylase (PgdA/CDA1 family)
MIKLKRITLIVLLTFLVTSGSFIIYQYLQLKNPGTIVLLYHKITQDESHNKYSLSMHKFEEQLKYLYENDYRTMLPETFFKQQYQKNAPKTLLISFDDGTVDHYSAVYPLLKKYGFSGIFFIVYKYVDHPGSLSFDQIKEMSRNNMEIGSHSYSHPYLDELDYDDIVIELQRSKDGLEEITGKEVISFAPPGGWFNQDVLKAAKELGYKFFFTCELGANDLKERPFVYKRIEVTGDMDVTDFERLLNPPEILGYKVMQSLKFLVHDILGSERYLWLSSLSFS